MARKNPHVGSSFESWLSTRKASARPSPPPPSTLKLFTINRAASGPPFWSRRPIVFSTGAAAVEVGPAGAAPAVAARPGKAATRAKLNAHKPHSRRCERQGCFRLVGRRSQSSSDRHTGRIELPNKR